MGQSASPVAPRGDGGGVPATGNSGGPSRRRYLVFAGILAVVAIAAVAFAASTKPSTVGSGSASGDGSVAPPLDAKGWINTAPLTVADLEGKVVLYDFWTYSCVNCVRTIPTVRAWYDTYRHDGLVVIGVHSPEFDFEKNHANVQAAVNKLGVDYPVALDDDMTIWNEFDNQYWPADYLYGRDGKQADVHFGEGGYAETEDQIRKLLGVPASAPRAVVRAHEGGSDGSTGITPESYLGAEQGSQGYSSPQPLVDGPATFTAPSTLDGNFHALSGRWTVSDQYIESGGAGSAIELRYTAGQVNLVMSTAGTTPIEVTVRVDDAKPTTVGVSAADLYNLVTGSGSGTHNLVVTAQAPGLRAYAFTFGG